MVLVLLIGVILMSGLSDQLDLLYREDDIQRSTSSDDEIVKPLIYKQFDDF